MIYSEMTKKAMKIAYEAHHGQLDHSGVPYIFHPFHLADQMPEEISCTVALLHDTIEDTQITLADLEKEFPPVVVEAVSLLTHDDTEDYFAYIMRIKENPIAKMVKLSDLNHNSDQSRCVGADLSVEKLAYWREKYRRAKEILLK